jgi:glycosyltransferase involved in cell wall biosynthesis
MLPAPTNHTTAAAPVAGSQELRPLEVCLGTLVFHPQYAGPAERFKRYAPGLRGLGVRLSVFSGLWDDADRVTGGAVGYDWNAPLHVVDGIPIHGVPLSNGHSERSIGAHALGLARFCGRNPEAVDVVQLLNLSPWSIPGLIRLRRAGIPVVFTHTMLAPPPTTLMQRLQRQYARLPYRFLDCVVVSSGVMRDSLRRGGIRGKISVIPNGVDLGRFRPLPEAERPALRERLGLDPDSEVILFLGGFLSERKGVDVLAAAWELVARTRPRAHLVMVGPDIDLVRAQDSRKAFVRRIKGMLAASGAGDRVALTGKVDNVEEYLQAADVFVFPSRREGMPNVVAEAFATGAPTVMTPFIGLPAEFGEPGTHYVLVDRTPHALATAISDLLDDPGRRDQLARAARQWVEDELALERSLQLYTTLYRELSHGGSTR